MTSSDDQQDTGKAVAAPGLDHDFYLVLSKAIDDIQQDPAKFRTIIYEMARVRLHKEAWHRNPPMNILELRRMTRALETAIERVEAQSAQHDAFPRLASSARAIPDTAPAYDEVVLIDQPPRHVRADVRTPLAWAPLRAIVRLGVVAAIAAAMILIDNEFHLLSPAPPAVEHVAVPAPTAPTTQATTALPAQQPVAPPRPSGPMPTVYGVYAVSGGRLYELDALAGRAPDLRMFMSAVIKTPSHTVLPDGDVSFIVYRRDIASSAPDHATVRVIAKIARVMTFSKSGQPVTAKVDGEWAIRNVSFDYRVAPSSDSSEMIVIKPRSEASPLPAGRYALVLKEQLFEFTIDGPITETVQCLERTAAANGTFYSECRHL